MVCCNPTNQWCALNCMIPTTLSVCVSIFGACFHLSSSSFPPSPIQRQDVWRVRRRVPGPGSGGGKLWCFDVHRAGGSNVNSTLVPSVMVSSPCSGNRLCKLSGLVYPKLSRYSKVEELHFGWERSVINTQCRMALSSVSIALSVTSFPEQW